MPWDIDNAEEIAVSAIGPELAIDCYSRVATEADKMIQRGKWAVAPRQADRALHASETRYRRLFETAQDGILILDAASGKIVDANPYMVKILGYSHSEFVGKELWEIGLFEDVS